MADNSDKIREVLVESARVQVAMMNAGIEFWKAWVNQASEFSRSINEQLMNTTQNNTNQDAVIGNITDSSLKFIREMSSLPGLYSKHFETQFSTMASNSRKQKSRRKAKAKN